MNNNQPSSNTPAYQRPRYVKRSSFTEHDPQNNSSFTPFKFPPEKSRHISKIPHPRKVEKFRSKSELMIFNTDPSSLKIQKGNSSQNQDSLLFLIKKLIHNEMRRCFIKLKNKDASKSNRNEPLPKKKKIQDLKLKYFMRIISSIKKKNDRKLLAKGFNTFRNHSPIMQYSNTLQLKIQKLRKLFFNKINHEICEIPHYIIGFFYWRYIYFTLMEANISITNIHLSIKNKEDNINKSRLRKGKDIWKSLDIQEFMEDSEYCHMKLFFQLDSMTTKRKQLGFTQIKLTPIDIIDKALAQCKVFMIKLNQYFLHHHNKDPTKDVPLSKSSFSGNVELALRFSQKLMSEYIMDKQSESYLGRVELKLMNLESIVTHKRFEVLARKFVFQEWQALYIEWFLHGIKEKSSAAILQNHYILSKIICKIYSSLRLKKYFNKWRMNSNLPLQPASSTPIISPYRLERPLSNQHKTSLISSPQKYLQKFHRPFSNKSNMGNIGTIRQVPISPLVIKPSPSKAFNDMPKKALYLFLLLKRLHSSKRIPNSWQSTLRSKIGANGIQEENKDKSFSNLIRSQNTNFDMKLALNKWKLYSFGVSHYYNHKESALHKLSGILSLKSVGNKKQGYDRIFLRYIEVSLIQLRQSYPISTGISRNTSRNQLLDESTNMRACGMKLENVIMRLRIKKINKAFELWRLKTLTIDLMKTHTRKIENNYLKKLNLRTGIKITNLLFQTSQHKKNQLKKVLVFFRTWKKATLPNQIKKSIRSFKKTKLKSVVLKKENKIKFTKRKYMKLWFHKSAQIKKQQNVLKNKKPFNCTIDKNIIRNQAFVNTTLEKELKVKTQQCLKYHNLFPLFKIIEKFNKKMESNKFRVFNKWKYFTCDSMSNFSVSNFVNMLTNEKIMLMSETEQTIQQIHFLRTQIEQLSKNVEESHRHQQQVVPKEYHLNFIEGKNENESSSPKTVKSEQPPLRIKSPLHVMNSVHSIHLLHSLRSPTQIYKSKFTQESSQGESPKDEELKKLLSSYNKENQKESQPLDERDQVSEKRSKSSENDDVPPLEESFKKNNLEINIIEDTCGMQGIQKPINTNNTLATSATSHDISSKTKKGFSFSPASFFKSHSYCNTTNAQGLSLKNTVQPQEQFNFNMGTKDQFNQAILEKNEDLEMSNSNGNIEKEQKNIQNQQSLRIEEGNHYVISIEQQNEELNNRLLELDREIDQQKSKFQKEKNALKEKIQIAEAELNFYKANEKIKN